MRLIRLVIVLSFIPLGLMNAQLKLSLNDAVKIGIDNNIELKRQSNAVELAEVELSSAGRLPNPEFSYSREDLKADNIKYNEWTATGSLPVNFLWERWSSQNSKTKALEARRIYLNYLKWNISSEIKKAYSLLQVSSLLHQNLNSALAELTSLSEAVKNRAAEGDLSEYESQRILLEVNKLKIAIKNAEVQKISFENNLKILTGIESAEKIQIDTLKQNFDIIMSMEEILELSLNNRSDLKALQLEIESGNSFISHNKLKSIPQINLSAGYKSQSDQLKGTVVEIGFEIPLFNRNQTAIEQSVLEVNKNVNELAFLKSRIKAEIREAYEKYMLNKNLIVDQRAFQYRFLYESASLSYMQGETTLVEFLDGVNAFIDGMMMNGETESEFISSYYELEKSIETSLNEKF